MPGKAKKLSKTKSGRKFLKSPMPELLAALILLGSSLRTTEVAVADDEAPKERTMLKTKKTTNTMKEKKLQNNAIKGDTAITPQTNTIKGAPAPPVEPPRPAPRK